MGVGFSFLELLKLHQELDDAFLSHQERLLSLDVAGARELLKLYRKRLISHMREEENLLLPIYERRAGRIPGGPVEMFLGEHKKMKAFVAEFLDELSRLRRVKRAGLKRAVITLFDREFMHKHLVEHHDLREKNVLYPVLDRITSEQERARLLDRCIGAGRRRKKDSRLVP